VMSTRTAFPFLTIPDDAITFGGWMIGDPGQPLHPAQELLEGWDYERDIEVAVDLEIDFDATSEVLDIAIDDLNLSVVLKAGTGAGSMPKRVDTLAVSNANAMDPITRISAAIRSRDLSSRLRLELSVLLASPPTRAGPLSPRWPGARMWHTQRDILLEDGGDSRFPIELMSFSRFFAGLRHAHAPWYLDWRADDFHADFGCAVRIYVNSDIPDIRERFVAGDSLTLQAILGDVMSQMIGAIFDHDGCEDLLSDCAGNTVGHQVRRWMDLAFPGQTIATMRATRSHAPGRFRAAILAAADVGETA
jgi:hypothetical protein